MTNYAYAVYFCHPTLTHNREDVFATSVLEAEGMLAAKYGQATHIKATFMADLS